MPWALGVGFGVLAGFTEIITTTRPFLLVFGGFWGFGGRDLAGSICPFYGLYTHDKRAGRLRFRVGVLDSGCGV